MIQRPSTSTTIIDELDLSDTELTPTPRPAPAPAPEALARGTGALAASAVANGTVPPPQRTRAPGPSNPPATAPGPASAGDALRTLIFAPERGRASWIEGELARAAVTIQVARRVRTVVAALIKDPPPRPQILIVDFDAVSPGELFELHVIRHEGWAGRLIGIGNVPAELCGSLFVDSVLPLPLIRDSLLDCVTGTRHASETVPIPVDAFVAFGLTTGRSGK